MVQAGGGEWWVEGHSTVGGQVALSDGGIVFLVTPGQSDKTSPARCSDKPPEIPSRIEAGRKKGKKRVFSD